MNYGQQQPNNNDFGDDNNGGGLGDENDNQFGSNQQQHQQYNASPSQFAGGTRNQGGFLTSPTQMSPGRTGDDERKGQTRNQSLTPVTIRQLYNATQAHPEDTTFKIDGKDVSQVTVVGQILRVAEQATNLNIQLDDGTGKIDVRIWVETEDNEYLHQKKTEWREGVYVRVIGNLRAFNSNRSLVAFRIRPITDFNELTFHLLEVIYVHLYNTRGPLHHTGGSAVGFNNSNTNVNNANMQNSFLPSQAQGDFNALQSAILELTGPSAGQAGVNIAVLTQKLSQLGSPQDIKTAIEFLTDEGHLYTTLDDHTYKSTS